MDEEIILKSEDNGLESVIVKEEYNYGEVGEGLQNDTIISDSIKCEDYEVTQVSNETVQFDITEISPDTHSGKNYFHCAHCPKKFLLRLGLKTHLSHGHKEITCNICQKIVMRSIDLKLHIENEHQVYKCLPCNKTFGVKSKLQQHFKTNHKWDEERNTTVYSIQFKCTICNMDFEKMSKLKQHYKTHFQKTFECLYCDKTFTRRANYEAHALKNHRGLPIDVTRFPITCSVCKVRFITFESMKKHSNAHTCDTIYSCGFCKNKFVTANGIKRHVDTTHKLIPLPNGFPDVWKMVICPTTGRSYYAHRPRNTSMKSAELSFKCPSCNREFLDENTLKSHIATHTVGKKQRQHTKNPAKDTAEYHKIYMKNVKNGKSTSFYMCRLCSRMFSTRDSVMEHEKTHDEYKNLDRVNSLYLLLKKANSAKNIVRSTNSSNKTSIVNSAINEIDED